MIVAGLTGGIASGKTTVARMFGEKGACVIDLDELARFVVEPNKPAWHDIIHGFGETVLRDDGTVDRERLGRVVFSDPVKRQQLEQIVHPKVLDEYKKRLKHIRQNCEQSIVIAEIPLLMEVGMEDWFEEVIVVYVPPESQITRLVERSGLSQQAAMDRLKSQISIEEKARLADFVIDNTGSLEETRRQVRDVYQALKRLDKEKPESIKDRGKEKG